MHLGISRPPAPPYPIVDVDGAVLAKIAEEVGFESIFYGEHPISPVEPGGHSVHSAGVPFFQDTLVMLARASAMTSRIKLGSGIFVLPLHQPVLFAKQLASLDYYSGGRLLVGIGAGWSRVECEAMGGHFDRRWAQIREQVQIMKSLWSEDVTEFRGEFYDIEPIRLYPKPVSRPWPPVLLPGPPFSAEEPMNSPKLRTAFKRIATYGDGWIPGRVGLEQMRTGPELIEQGRAVLREICEEVGRDYKELQVTALLRTEIHDGDLEWPELVSKDVIRRYEDSGVERAVVTIPTVTSEEHAREVIERVAAMIL